MDDQDQDTGGQSGGNTNPQPTSGTGDADDQGGITGMGQGNVAQGEGGETQNHPEKDTEE